MAVRSCAPASGSSWPRRRRFKTVRLLMCQNPSEFVRFFLYFLWLKWFKLKAFLQIARCLRCFVFAFVWQIVADFQWDLVEAMHALGVSTTRLGSQLKLLRFFCCFFPVAFSCRRCVVFDRFAGGTLRVSCRCVVVSGALHKETVDRPWPMAQIWHDMTDVNLFHFYVCLKMICFILIYVKRYSKHFDINDIKRKPRTCFSWMLPKRTRLQVSSSEVRSKQEKTSGWWGISGTGTSCHS